MPRDKTERQGTLRAKRAENFQGLQINFEKFLLVYFMRPPDLEALGVMRLFEPRGSVAIYLLSAALYIGQRSIFLSNRLIRWCNQLNFELHPSV